MPVDTTKAKEIKQRFERLKSRRASTFDTVWQDLSDYLFPRKSDVNTEKTPGVEDYTQRLYDMTAANANQVLSAGIVSNSTPPTERWFAFNPPEAILKDRMRRRNAVRWFEECTQIAMRQLAVSNFYTEIHECHLDRNTMGTCALHTQEGRRTALNFRSFRIGTYVIDVDSEGIVDTVMREFKMTPRQAAQQFGEANLGPKFGGALKKANDADDMMPVLHVVMPRADVDRIQGRQDGPNKPVASIYISCEDDHVLEESGYDEMSIAVSRYLAWSDELWGYSPGIEVLPIVRQVNFIEQQMDALAEVAAFPRVLIPDTLADQVDLRAAGVTTFDPNNPQAVPREWGTQGRYDIGKDRVAEKQEFIRNAFHNDLFRMFAQLERQITATEAVERASEKLEGFSPTFQRITSELLSPTLMRVFSILFRGGFFPDPPAEVFVPTMAGVGLARPEVVYTSKIALALKAMENRSFMQLQQVLAPLVQANPDIMDNFDEDLIARDVAYNMGLPTRWIRDDREVIAMREQRAAQMAAREDAMMAATAAKAAGDMGRAPPALQEAVGAA